MSHVKVDTSEKLAEVKLGLRREVLERVPGARVLDLFAGTQGTMWAGVWQHANHYVGLERRMWRSDEPHPRLIVDNREALEVLHLGSFNVFDFDAYGAPWGPARVVASRRGWGRGEMGAFVLTDGSALRLRTGDMPAESLQLCPTHPQLGRGDFRQVTEETHEWCVARLVDMMRVRPVWWRLHGDWTGRGGGYMVYSAVVFEGASCR